MTKITHIVACDKNGGIGLNGELVWHLPAELKHFKDATLGHACLVGRTTAEKLPVLPRRVVLTVSSANPLEQRLSEAQAFCEALSTNEIFIIGGAKLYESTADIVDRVIITKIMNKFDCDTFYKMPQGMKLKELKRTDCDTNRMTGLIEEYAIEVWEK